MAHENHSGGKFGGETQALPLAEGSALHLLAKLRSRGHSCRIAVLTSRECPFSEEYGLAASADAFYDQATEMVTLFAELAQVPQIAAGGDGSTLLREGRRACTTTFPYASAWRSRLARPSGARR